MAGPRDSADARPGLPILGQVEEQRERADAVRNRRRILDAARKLMKKRPLHEICMDEVARVAGVGKGTIYRRFVDRASLFHALLDDGERRLQDQILRGFDLPRSTTPSARLYVLLDALFSFVADNAQILAEAEASAHKHGNRFESVPYQWRKRELSRWIEASRAADGSSPDDVADMILATLSAELIAHRLAEGRPEPELRRVFLQTWRRALAL